LGGAGGDDLDAVLEAVVDRPRMQAVDADAAVGHLARGGAHEPDDGVLGGRVAGDPRVGQESDDARVEDQAAAVAHDRERVLVHEERALDVDRDHVVEDVLGVVDDRRRVAEDAGVGEGDVEAAEALGRDAHRRGDLLGVGHVGHDIGGVLGADLVGHEGEALLVDVGQDDLGPLLGEEPRGGGPDAPSAPGDQRDLALESTHGGGRLPHRVRVPAMAGDTVGTARDATVAGNGGTPAPTVREATFDVLRTLGLTRIFSNPGSTEVSFLAGLPDDLEFVLGLHEGSVVGMATGYALGRGAPAFALLHTTAGLGNAVAALATARVNRAPLVVMVGQ